MIQKASTEEIVTAYRETGSVWEAAKRLGMAGQSVHERLVSIGYPMRGCNWTVAETDELRRLRADGVPLGQIARSLGRPYSTCATKASELGLPRVAPPAAIPRGAGFDKVSMARHMKALETYDGSLRQYVRAHGLWIEPFVRACQKHFPDRWRVYAESRSDLPQKRCEYCESEFVPLSGKQRFCTRRCGITARDDANYFGGRRRETIGLVEGVCQCCGVKPTKGLSAHHVLGRDNDAEHRALVALCAGCHQVITALGGRTMVDVPAFWESLIALVWLRKNGANHSGQILNVYVEVDLEEDA